MTEVGCPAIVWDIDLDALRGSTFRPTLAQHVDVTDLESIQSAFHEIVRVFGRVDILVNNAGTSGPIASVPYYPIEACVMRIDLTGVFYCCRIVVPHLRRRGYVRIVNVSSIARKEGRASVAAYCAPVTGPAAEIANWGTI